MKWKQRERNEAGRPWQSSSQTPESLQHRMRPLRTWETETRESRCFLAKDVYRIENTWYNPDWLCWEKTPLPLMENLYKTARKQNRSRLVSISSIQEETLLSQENISDEEIGLNFLPLGSIQYSSRITKRLFFQNWLVQNRAMQFVCSSVLFTQRRICLYVNYCMDRNFKIFDWYWPEEDIG